MKSGTAELHSQGQDSEGWEPEYREELKELLFSYFEEPEIRTTIKNTTLRILRNCIDPNGQNPANTGLVTGYVQSGKTLSFTALTAAACDNDYRVIILISGTKLILMDQSRDRLIKDLRVTQSWKRPWKPFHNATDDNFQDVSSTLEAWLDPDGDRRTVLITVLKEHHHLRSLRDLFQMIPEHLRTSALIIDDECDQASLNNKIRGGKMSTTYAEIRKLRDCFPNHSYVQYTATPQAPIFIPLIDVLSPDFCEVLDPGSGYTGGKAFFQERVDELVKTIPPDEVAIEGGIDPPPHLHKALRDFWIGVAHGRITDGERPRNRSMMVHPSHLISDHQIYETWVQQYKNQCKLLLADNGNPDRKHLVEEFETHYADLNQTMNGELAPFSQILGELVRSITGTRVITLNSRTAGENWGENWGSDYAWILIGGENLNRGFTVEGLTVTYMPRGPGSGLADTIQQRGRFFGYKQDYLGLCRVYLESEVKNAFEVYVESEESMRDFLRRKSKSGALKDPDDLVREFQEDRRLYPCRRSILLQPPRRKVFYTGNWWSQKYPHKDTQSAERNRKTVLEFIQDNGLEETEARYDRGWLRDPTLAKETHIHRVVDNLTISQLCDELLCKLTMDKNFLVDREGWDFVLTIAQDLARPEANPDEPAGIIWIRPDITSKRGTTEGEAVSNIFQGPYPKAGAGRVQGSVYAGDRHVHIGKMTLQIHTLDIYKQTASKTDENLIARQVTTLALWLHEELHKDYISQDQSLQ